ncbi:hypothetical protein [Salininema proteolyticum]|uniref:Uncharacterized protein n=1 Tax=Salininema proteolyticum TaxID=1607685 RepID=A0ABV8TXH9_9ACTN
MTVSHEPDRVEINLHLAIAYGAILAYLKWWIPGERWPEPIEVNSGNIEHLARRMRAVPTDLEGLTRNLDSRPQAKSVIEVSRCWCDLIVTAGLWATYKGHRDLHKREAALAFLIGATEALGEAVESHKRVESILSYRRQ